MSDAEFHQYQRLVERLTGIHLGPIKKAMLSGRLARRIQQQGCTTFSSYFRLIDDGGDTQERQIAIDLITTNETYFFREPKHFDALRERFLPGFHGRPIRAWSAACSSGEEPYSLAMVMADVLGEQGAWEILGSDISTRMLAAAKRGLYPIERAHHIPPNYLKRYCLRGIGEYTGHFLMERVLRSRVNLVQVNLSHNLPEMGRFDLIMLRNVIIYFDADLKRRVIQAITNKLKPGGWLIMGHSESLIAPPTELQQVAPTIYRRAGN